MNDDNSNDQIADYQYDVFISYRRAELGLEWVANVFKPLLQKHLEVCLGERPRIFFDENSIEAGQIPAAKVKQAIRASKILVCVWSHPYFKSRWCLAEMQTFHERAEVERLTDRGESLTVPLQWQDGESYVERMTERFPQIIDVRKFRRTNEGFRQTTDFDEMETALSQLAERLAIMIEDAPPFRADWPLILPADVTVPERPSNRQRWRL